MSEDHSEEEDQRLTAVRQAIGASSMVLMDQLDTEVIGALKAVNTAAAIAVGVLRDHDVGWRHVSSMLLAQVLSPLLNGMTDGQD